MLSVSETIVITWMDGTRETYSGESRVYEGVLHIYSPEQTVHIPLANVRHWTKP